MVKLMAQKAQIGTYSYSISVVDFNDRLFIYPEYSILRINEKIVVLSTVTVH